MDKIESFKAAQAEAQAATLKTREFLSSFTDERSFVETNAFCYSENDTFKEKKFYGEGAVTGFATVNGYPVCVFAENADVLRGGFGIKQAEKIAKLIETAVSTKTPIVGVFESVGARLGEGVSSLEGYAKLYECLTYARNNVPTYAIVKGECYGQIVYAVKACDFVLMMENAHVATTSPVVLSAKSNKGVNLDGDFGAKTMASGLLLNEMTVNEGNLKEKLTSLFDYTLSEDDDLDETFDLSGDNGLNGGATALETAKSIVDDNSLTEIYEGFCDWNKTFFAEIGGKKVGIITADVLLSAFGARRFLRFISICNNFDLPIISIVNSNGSTKDLQGEGALIDAVDALMYSVASVSVPMISVVINAAGVSYTALCAKSLGFDYVVAWANACISPLPKDMGAAIAYADDIAKRLDKDKALQEAEEKYAEIEANPISSAMEGYVDTIIEPSLTRANVIAALATLKYKE